MKTLFIVVDMLNGFTKIGPLASEEILKIIPNIKREIVKYENNIFLCDSHSKKDLEMLQYPLHCLAGTEESEIVAELKPYVKNILLKNSTNSFHKFDKGLIKEYDDFVLTGCCTDICVLQFALTLKTYLNEYHIDKKVKVIEDCVATFNTEGHDSETYHKYALNLMKQAGIEII